MNAHMKHNKFIFPIMLLYLNNVDVKYDKYLALIIRLFLKHLVTVANKKF